MQPQILVNFGLGGRTMILADKIIEERKKNGWTQEDLAQKTRCIQTIGFKMGKCRSNSRFKKRLFS